MNIILKYIDSVFNIGKIHIFQCKELQMRVNSGFGT